MSRPTCGRASSLHPIFKRRAIVPIVFASVLIGCAIGLFAWWFARAILETDGQDEEWRYDRVRITELRRLDPLYRWLYPLFVPLARINRNAFHGSLKEIQRE